MKLVFLGDSLTAGRYGGDFVAEVARLMPDDEIINAGQGGNTVINLMRRLEDDVLALEPDGVFVMVGGNDSISYGNPVTRPYYKKAQNIPEGFVSPEQYEQTYRNLLHELQANRIQAWVGLAPKEYNPETINMQKQFNTIAADVAQSFNIPTLDIMAYFNPQNVKERPAIGIDMITLIGKRQSAGWADYETEQQREGYQFTFDGLHLIPQAAKEIGQLVAEFIRQN